MGPGRSPAEAREGGIREGSEDLSKGLGGPGNLYLSSWGKMHCPSDSVTESTQQADFATAAGPGFWRRHWAAGTSPPI